MAGMTLRQVCDTCGVSRRAVQGYERAGLVSASRRNERGYLLYDIDEQERIRQIRFYQQIGFTIKEIQVLLKSSEAELKERLWKQAKKLEHEKKEKEDLIKKVYELIERL